MRISIYGRMSDGEIRRLSGYESRKSSEKDSRINAHSWHLLTINLAEQLPSPKLVSENSLLSPFMLSKLYRGENSTPSI